MVLSCLIHNAGVRSVHPVGTKAAFMHRYEP